MDSIKTIDFDWKYGRRELAIEVNTYADNKRLYVGLLAKEEGEFMFFADLTINLPDQHLEPDEAFVKDFNENEGFLDLILDNKLGEVMPGRGYSGFCSYPKVKFDIQRLQEFDPIGVGQYLHLRSKHRGEEHKRPKRDMDGMER